MERIKVSIIVPVFNQENFIGNCIESLASQTYENIEIIIVDDGSTDKSGAICDKYEKNDDRIRVLHKHNGGLRSARNAGLTCATGSYITYVDSDDWVDLDYVERLVDGVKSYKADIVIAAGYMNEAENGITKVFGKIPCGYYEGKNLDEFFYSHMLTFSNDCLEYGVHPFMCNKLFESSIIKKIQLSAPIDIVKGEDVMCTYPCLLMANSVVVLSMSSYHYRRWEGSLTMKKEHESIRELVYRHKCIFKEFEKAGMTDSVKKQFYIYYWHNLCQQTIEVLFDPDLNLIPYDIKKGDNVVIYGMGERGKQIISILDSYCNVVSSTDSRAPYSNEEVIFPIQLLDTDYDKVLVAVKAKRHLDEIVKLLREIGVPSSKITTLEFSEKCMEFIDEITNRYGGME